jgi:hypothetical protein
VPTQNVHEKNPVNPPMAQVAAKSLEEVATLVDQNEQLENEILWALYGTGTMPAPKHNLQDFGFGGGPVTDGGG